MQLPRVGWCVAWIWADRKAMIIRESEVHHLLAILHNNLDTIQNGLNSTRLGITG